MLVANKTRKWEHRELFRPTNIYHTEENVTVSYKKHCQKNQIVMSISNYNGRFLECPGI